MRLPYPRPHRLYAPRKYRMPRLGHAEVVERQVGGKGQAEDEADARVTTTPAEVVEAGATHEGGAQEVVTATRAGAGAGTGEETPSAGRETSITAHEEGVTTTRRAGSVARVSTATSAHVESETRHLVETGATATATATATGTATGESPLGTTHTVESSITATHTEESVTDAATITVARSSVLHPIYVNSFPSDFPIETQTKGAAGTLGRGYAFLPHNMVADSMLLFITFFFSLLILTISCIKISTCLNRRRGGGKEDTVIGEEMRWAEGRTVLERKIVWDTGSVYGSGGRGEGYGAAGGRPVARGRTPVGESKLRL